MHTCTLRITKSLLNKKFMIFSYCDCCHFTGNKPTTNSFKRSSDDTAIQGKGAAPNAQTVTSELPLKALISWVRLLFTYDKPGIHLLLSRNLSGNCTPTARGCTSLPGSGTSRERKMIHLLQHTDQTSCSKVNTELCRDIQVHLSTYRSTALCWVLAAFSVS
jgi:hypothetical protein